MKLNDSPYIKECILSILNQTYAAIEIIVVDDGSIDTTPSIIDKIADQDARIIPIHQQNAGVSAARNTGIQVSKGKYLVFVDGDDYIAPDFVEYMLKLIQETGAEMCLSLNCFTKDKDIQVQNDIITILNPSEATAFLLSPRLIVGCWNKIYKKSVLVENNLLFSTNLFYGEGLMFYTAYAQLCNKVGIGNRKVYYYRRNNYTSATTKFDIRSLVNGNQSIEEIRKKLKLQDSSIHLMLDLHQCLFSMGAVVRIKANKKENVYKEEYKWFQGYLHKNTPKFIFKRVVPLYRKGLLIGTCLSPSLMAWLDNYRRKRIAAMSVK